jgi:hypothetical protein
LQETAFSGITAIYDARGKLVKRAGREGFPNMPKDFNAARGVYLLR